MFNSLSLGISLLLACLPFAGCAEDSDKKRDRDSDKKRRLVDNMRIHLFIEKLKIVRVSKNLDAFWTCFISNSNSAFPDGSVLSEKTPAGFAAYAWDKWRWQHADFWFMEDAADVMDHNKYGTDGMPEFIGDGDGGLDTDVTSDQKKAIS